MMDKRKYLERIGLADIENKCTYDVLERLQFAHLTTVPYENLDLIHGVPLSLKVEDIYSKVVEHNRGGYCFEVNCLFQWLLQQFGFETTAYFARFWRGSEGVPMKRHRIVRTELSDGSYICDVGIGSKAPKFPLKLVADEVQNGYGESYKMVRDKDFGWMVYEFTKGEWQKYYSFNEIPSDEIDFVTTSYYCEVHPESLFNKTHIISLKTADGRLTINDHDYKEFVGDDVSFVEANMSDERIKEVLKDKFGLVAEIK